MRRGALQERQQGSAFFVEILEDVRMTWEQHEQLEQKKAVLEACVAGAVSFLEEDGNIADGLVAAWLDFKRVFEESTDVRLCDPVK